MKVQKEITSCCKDSERRTGMSTLEKNIRLLNTLTKKQIENINSYILFLVAQQKEKDVPGKESVDDIIENIVGAVGDSGKSLEEYREERITEKYEVFN